MAVSGRRRGACASCGQALCCRTDCGRAFRRVLRGREFSRAAPQSAAILYACTYHRTAIPVILHQDECQSRLHGQLGTRPDFELGTAAGLHRPARLYLRGSPASAKAVSPNSHTIDDARQAATPRFPGGSSAALFQAVRRQVQHRIKAHARPSGRSRVGGIAAVPARPHGPLDGTVDRTALAGAAQKQAGGNGRRPGLHPAVRIWSSGSPGILGARR